MITLVERTLFITLKIHLSTEKPKCRKSKVTCLKQGRWVGGNETTSFAIIKSSDTSRARWAAMSCFVRVSWGLRRCAWFSCWTLSSYWKRHPLMSLLYIFSVTRCSKWLPWSIQYVDQKGMLLILYGTMNILSKIVIEFFVISLRNAHFMC